MQVHVSYELQAATRGSGMAFIQPETEHIFMLVCVGLGTKNTLLGLGKHNCLA